ncbi:MAG: TonB-dependent receptor plug domain-containing protein, partial [Pseudomonadales bacterium]|nr:TonB-dependent receptor plug domain-containing protein [Pseudomonadales bacterium]
IEEIIVEGQATREGITDLAIDVARFGTQVQLISSVEIETGGFTNFGELASGLIRGANIGYSPDEGEFTIRIDGGTDRDTLLLLDGVPTFDRGTPLESLWGATAIDPRMIENVEIFRGGQSLYFGGNGGLGVVNVLYKRPEAGDDMHGEFGVYAGDFRTREMYGNVTFPINDDHYLMFFGRSYETNAHEIFTREMFTDNVQALGGFHKFPYSYNNLGIKYLWAPSDETEFRIGYQHSTIDFRDSFPHITVFQPNFTEFPMWETNFRHEFSDDLRLEIQGYYTNPRLWNTELDARVCNIPRLGDLPQEFQDLAAAQGITGFSTATEFETFANATPGLPAGCVTNPFGNRGLAAVQADVGYYVDDDGNPYGTVDNPFPIGAPIGYVIQSVASFGTGAPTKGFGEVDQFKAGYNDWGINSRLRYSFNENFEGVIGFQNITYEDGSHQAYGMTDDKVETNGLYGEVRFSSDRFIQTNFSISARQDFNDAFDDEDIWKYGFRQELPAGFYFRSNGGTSYSQPTLREAGFRGNTVANPTLQTQRVETYSLGTGINGNAFGGTYNVEVGYFDTVIDNQFGSDALEDVCLNFPGVTPADINPNIIPPLEFCDFALAQGLDRLDVAFFNTDREQDISGVTLDIAFDTDLWQADFTYTDMESLEPNPLFGQMARLDGSPAALDFVVPGAAGASPDRQSSERPEWSASLLLTFTPSERWIFAVNTAWQGPEWAYANTRASRIVDSGGNRLVPDLNFGDYTVVNGSIQYFLGDDLQHRFLLRAVNLFDEDYFERAGLGDQRISVAGVRGEVGPDDGDYYYRYGWWGKPRSFWLQYEYQF